MKVLWISHLVPYPPKAGVLIRSNSLLMELSKFNDVDVFAFNQKKLLSSYYSSEEEGLAQSREALSHYVRKQWVFGIPSEKNRAAKLWLIISSFFSVTPYSVKWLRSKEALGALTRILNENKYDLVHFDTISLDIMRTALNANVPTILDHHNIESHMMHRRCLKETNPLKKLYFKWEAIKLHWYEKKHVPCYTGNIVCSNDDDDRLSEIANVKSSAVVANGIDTDRISVRRSPEPGRLLFVGGLSWYPNIEAINYFLSEIAPMLDENNVDYQIDIIGKGAPDFLLRKYSDHKRVHFHGYVDDIRKFYSEASVYICPILDGGGTKLKVLDAMAHGLPVVGTDMACEGLDVEHGKHVLIANSPTEFVSEIQKLLDGNISGKYLGENALSLVKKKYSYEQVGIVMRKYYESIIREGL